MSKKQRGKKSLFSLVIIIALLLAGAKIVVSNRLATFGQRLSQIDQEIKDLRKEKYLLEEKIYQLASLEKINQRAQELGFCRTNEIVYLSLEVPVALR
jgi:cell division protein FtsL